MEVTSEDPELDSTNPEEPKDVELPQESKPLEESEPNVGSVAVGGVVVTGPVVGFGPVVGGGPLVPFGGMDEADPRLSVSLPELVLASSVSVSRSSETAGPQPNVSDTHPRVKQTNRIMA